MSGSCKGLCGDGRLERIMGPCSSYVEGFHMGVIADGLEDVANLKVKVEVRARVKRTVVRLGTSS
jgi:hypothetical protein